MRAGKDLTVGKESKLIVQFALPMLAGGVLQQLYTFVDSIIVGNYLGPNALGAVGSSFPVIFALISIIIGIAMGATIVISQYFGAKDLENVKRTIDTINIFIFVAGLIMSIVGILMCRQIFIWLDQPPESIDYAVEYLTVYLGGIIVFFGYNSVAAILRGLGDSRTPLFFMLISTVINIILDYLFIAILGYGIASAAYATIIAQGIAFIVAVYYLNNYHKIVRISFRNLVFDKSLFWKSMKIGLPSGMQHFFVSLGMVALFRIVNEFGAATNTAYSIAMRIDGLAGVPGMIFAGALSTFVGQNLGAGKIDRAKTGLFSTLKITAGIAIALSALLYIFREPILSAFTRDEEVIQIGVRYLQITSWFYIVFYGMFMFNGFLRGAGDTIVPMFITLFGLWALRVPISYLLSLKFGEVGIWWGIPVAWASGLMLSFLYYLTGKWRKKVVVDKKLD
ncbi:MAG: MATE family efflux transporter [Marinilabiliales bacterium]|nr:MAG: MATE family efflux transporter [Marinilabiliales bacterium]